YKEFVQDFAISAICVTDNDPFYLKALNSIPNQYSQCKLIIKAGIRKALEDYKADLIGLDGFSKLQDLLNSQH
ncbi:MAG: hypothetical protein WC942_12280, partial [Clostridia bacterium]